MKETTEGKSEFILMPAKKGTCPICAVAHEAHLPHNRDSLYYQTRFYMEHKRNATWADAMAHCTDEMKAFWIKSLKKAGVKV